MSHNNLSYAHVSHNNLSYTHTSHNNLSYAHMSHNNLSYTHTSHNNLSYTYTSHNNLSYTHTSHTYTLYISPPRHCTFTTLACLKMFSSHATPRHKPCYGVVHTFSSFIVLYCDCASDILGKKKSGGWEVVDCGQDFLGQRSIGLVKFDMVFEQARRQRKDR